MWRPGDATVLLRGHVTAVAHVARLLGRLASSVASYRESQSDLGDGYTVLLNAPAAARLRGTQGGALLAMLRVEWNAAISTVSEEILDHKVAAATLRVRADKPALARAAAYAVAHALVGPSGRVINLENTHEQSEPPITVAARVLSGRADRCTYDNK